MKFGITPHSEARRELSKKRMTAGGSDTSIAATSAMTAENAPGERDFEFDDFCFGGGNDEAAIARERIANGECPGCGVLCYEIDQFSGRRGRPLDEPGAIEDGVCLMCEIADPTNMNSLTRDDGGKGQDDEVVVTQAEYRVQFDSSCRANGLPFGSKSPSHQMRSKRPSLLLLAGAGAGAVRRASLTMGKPSAAAESKQRAELEEKIAKAISTLMQRTVPDASVLSALTNLINLISKDKTLAGPALSSGVIPAILSVMSRYQAHTKIQCRTCTLICLLTRNSNELALELIAVNRGVTALLELMKAHSKNTQVLQEACIALYQVTALPRNAGEIIANDVNRSPDQEGPPQHSIGLVLDLLVDYDAECDVANHLMGVLYNIGKVQISSFSQYGALLDIILRVMKKNKKSKDMQRISCMLLNLLASECPLETRAHLVKLNAVPQLMSALKNVGLVSVTESSGIVVKHAFMTLSALAVGNANARVEILNYKDRTGLNVIMDCLKKHEANVHVQTEGCRLLKYLAGSKDEAGRRTAMALKGKSASKVIDRAHGIVAQEYGKELSHSIRI